MVSVIRPFDHITTTSSGNSTSNLNSNTTTNGLEFAPSCQSNPSKYTVCATADDSKYFGEYVMSVKYTATMKNIWEILWTVTMPTGKPVYSGMSC